MIAWAICTYIYLMLSAAVSESSDSNRQASEWYEDDVSLLQSQLHSHVNLPLQKGFPHGYDGALIQLGNDSLSSINKAEDLHSFDHRAHLRYYRLTDFQYEYWSSVALSIPTVIVGVLIPWIFPDETGLSQAFCAVFLWGVKGYLIALSIFYSQKHPEDVIVGITYLAWVWTAVIFSMVGFHVYFKFSNEGYQEEWSQLPSLPVKTILAYVFAAITACVGEAVLQVGFGEGIEASGPHYAISTAYSVIVAPFFWMYADERMSGGQILAMAVTIGGACVMSATDVSSVLISFGALVLWSSDAIAFRIAGIWGSPPCVGVLLRLGLMFLCGVVSLVFLHGFRQVPMPTSTMLLVPLYNSVCDALSMASLIRAFESKNCKTGVVTGVLPAQTVVMTLLNFFIMDWQPQYNELVGGAITMLGCAAMCRW